MVILLLPGGARRPGPGQRGGLASIVMPSRVLLPTGPGRSFQGKGYEGLWLQGFWVRGFWLHGFGVFGCLGLSFLSSGVWGFLGFEGFCVQGFWL